jgi:hypothetical protein
MFDCCRNLPVSMEGLLPSGRRRCCAGRGVESAIVNKSHLAGGNPAGGSLFDALNYAGLILSTMGHLLGTKLRTWHQISGYLWEDFS